MNGDESIFLLSILQAFDSLPRNETLRLISVLEQRLAKLRDEMEQGNVDSN